jgi:hypothetical protein
MAEGYPELRNERVGAANGLTYAYRDTGAGQDTVPLVLLFLSFLLLAVVGKPFSLS